MTETDVRKLKGLLETMQKADPTFRVYGSDHQYQIAPPLSNEELLTFETAYGITLPADYRFFLNEVGNGGRRWDAAATFERCGAGPGGGLNSLEKTINGSDLSQPFPLTEDTEFESTPEVEEWWEDERLPGVLEICYYGGPDIVSTTLTNDSDIPEAETEADERRVITDDAPLRIPTDIPQRRGNVRGRRSPASSGGR